MNLDLSPVEYAARLASQVPYRIMEGSGLRWLAKQASTRFRIVNVGCWTGASTMALAAASPGFVYAVDPWDVEHCQFVKPLYRSWAEGRSSEWMYQTFLNNMVPVKNVFPIRATSMEAATMLHGVRFDMVFIDASHKYYDVVDDITAWRQLLVPGGLLCGHDYQHDEVGEGVIRAVDELIPQSAVGPDGIWYWRLPL